MEMQRSAGHCHKARRRLVLKNGECNVVVERGPKGTLRYLQDIVNTLVDMPWRWVLALFVLSFFVTWLGFALLWWLVALAHGDLDPPHLPEQQGSSGWTPCITNISGFPSCFLFSVENQHTTGFGTRTPTEECPEAVFLLCAQSILGVAWQSLVVGIVFAKAIRPKKRKRTLLFSRNAVVCLRDGHLCLVARVADMRRSNFAEAKVRMQLVASRVTAEGEPVDAERTELPLVSRDSDTGFYLLWPEALVHRMDERSPLHGLSAAELRHSRHEVVVLLEGTIEATDQRVQVRSSYLPEEILWGHRFRSMLSYDQELGSYRVDHNLLDCTYPVVTPLCSARELKKDGKMQHCISSSGAETREDESPFAGRPDPAQSSSQRSPS